MSNTSFIMRGDLIDFLQDSFARSQSTFRCVSFLLKETQR